MEFRQALEEESHNHRAAFRSIVPILLSSRRFSSISRKQIPFLAAQVESKTDNGHQRNIISTISSSILSSFKGLVAVSDVKQRI